MHRGLREDRERRGCSSTCCQLVGADFMSARCVRVGINPTPTDIQANNLFTC